MKEFFERCEHVSYTRVRNLILLDTCFFVNFLGYHKDLRLVEGKAKLATTSFNAQELLHVEHKLGHDLKTKLRKFFKHTSLLIVDVPVSPGNRESECEFVRSVDDKLLANVPDPSDAVLIAAAIRTGSMVVTKDKHHLFTVKLESFLRPYNIVVYKDLKFLAGQSF